MAISDDRILDLNPWWRDPTAIDHDPKIQILRERSLRWDPPVLNAMRIGPRMVHTLRGPRQVGKSTTSKRLIQRLLGEGERRVLYYAFDLVTSNEDIVTVIRQARALHPEPEGPWYLFLDEVTTIPDWQLGVKFVVDNGPAHEDFVLCTGSSARSVGSERLPGRRGDGRHYVQLPVSFRDFCRSVMNIELPGPALLPSEMLTPDASRVLRTLHLAGTDLERAWRVYATVGGFPAAIEDYLQVGEVRSSTIEMLWDIVAGDVRDLGRDAVATVKLLERVNRSLGTPLSWSALAGDMDVTQPTARDYVKMLAESFILLVVYFWDRSGAGLSPRKQRKVYFLDPLLSLVPRRLVPGTRPPGADALRENLVGSGLFRSSIAELVQAEPGVGSLCFWKSGRGTEIDFVLPGGPPATGRLPIEVKGDSARAVSSARKSIGAAFGRGLIVTASLLDLDHPIPAIPAPVFLAGLTEHLEREPS